MILAVAAAVVVIGIIAVIAGFIIPSTVGNNPEAKIDAFFDACEDNDSSELLNLTYGKDMVEENIQ